MWDPDSERAETSFREPIADPGTEVDASPLVCIFVSQSWQKILAGCALQVCQPPTWAVDDPSALADVVRRGEDLLYRVATAGVCVPSEDGVVSITIPAGEATATAAVTFSGTYATAPVVLVSSDNFQLAATVSDRSTTGFTAHLTASVPVTSDTTANVLWGALT